MRQRLKSQARRGLVSAGTFVALMLAASAQEKSNPLVYVYDQHLKAATVVNLQTGATSPVYLGDTYSPPTACNGGGWYVQTKDMATAAEAMSQVQEITNCLSGEKFKLVEDAAVSRPPGAKILVPLKTDPKPIKPPDDGDTGYAGPKITP